MPRASSDRLMLGPVTCSAWAELFNTHAHIYYSSAITIDYLLPLCDNTVSRYQVAIRGVNLQNCYPRSQVAIRGVNLQIAIRDHKSLSAASVYKSLSTITSRYPRCQSASRYPRCQSVSRYPRSQVAIRSVNLQVAIRGVNLAVGGTDLAIGITYSEVTFSASIQYWCSMVCIVDHQFTRK